MAMPLVIAQMTLLSVMLWNSVTTIKGLFFATDATEQATPILAIFTALLITAGIVLAVWAKRSMPAGTFSVSPSPRASSTLTLLGPYQRMRHPMYTGLILAATGMTLLQGGFTAWLILVALLAVLLAKIEFEEAELTRKFPHYKQTFHAVAKLIPGLY